jgi:hypothetical protein
MSLGISALVSNRALCTVRTVSDAPKAERSGPIDDQACEESLSSCALCDRECGHRSRCSRDSPHLVPVWLKTTPRVTSTWKFVDASMFPPRPRLLTRRHALKLEYSTTQNDLSHKSVRIHLKWTERRRSSQNRDEHSRSPCASAM